MEGGHTGPRITQYSCGEEWERTEERQGKKRVSTQKDCSSFRIRANCLASQTLLQLTS